MRISVAMTLFNGEKYFASQLESVLAQQVPVDEIVVCDDASGDRSREILQSYAARFPQLIKPVYHAVNQGCTAAFNSALQQCRGEYILLSDHDDVWEKDKSEVLLRQLAEHPDADACFSDSAAVNGDLEPLNFSFWQMRNFTGKMQKQLYRDPLAVMLKRVPVAMHSVALRRRALEYLLPLPELPGFYPDSFVALAVAFRSQWTATARQLTRYRIHEKNVTAPQLAGLSRQLELSRAVRQRNGCAQTVALAEAVLKLDDGSVSPEKVASVTAFRDFYRRRAALPPELCARIIRCMSELRRGTYFRYANDWKSLAADLFLPGS